MTTKKQLSMFKLQFILSGLVVFSLIVLATNSLNSGALASEKHDITLVKGTVKNIIIIQKPDGEIVKILELGDGKKYRLRQPHKQGIGEGFDVELLIPAKFDPIKDEVSAIYPNTIPVISIRVTAIPIPGSRHKLIYQPH